jgi:hypothetical protein
MPGSLQDSECSFTKQHCSGFCQKRSTTNSVAMVRACHVASTLRDLGVPHSLAALASQLLGSVQ